jgi:hypothetical protein
MQLPRLRLTILGLMLLVATTATGLWIWVGVMRASRQAEIYRDKAVESTHSEQYHRNRAANIHNSAMLAEVRLDLRREDARDERDRRFVRRDERFLEYSRALERFEARARATPRGAFFGAVMPNPWTRPNNLVAADK